MFCLPSTSIHPRPLSSVSCTMKTACAVCAATRSSGGWPITWARSTPARQHPVRGTVRPVPADREQAAIGGNQHGADALDHLYSQVVVRATAGLRGLAGGKRCGRTRHESYGSRRVLRHAPNAAAPSQVGCFRSSKPISADAAAVPGVNDNDTLRAGTRSWALPADRKHLALEGNQYSASNPVIGPLETHRRTPRRDG